MTVAKKRFLGSLALALALHALALFAIGHAPRLAVVTPPRPDLIYVVLQQPSKDFRMSRLEGQARFAPTAPGVAPRSATAPSTYHVRPKPRLANARPELLPPPSPSMAIPRLSRESIGVSSPAAKPPTGAGATDDIDRSGQVAYAPEPVERVVPEYPSAARSRGIEGQVILRAIVDPDGHIEDSIEVVRAVPALDQAAIAALRQWLFRPARDRNGRPLRVRIEVPVVFVLR